MIVIKDWLRLKPWEKLIIVTSENHLEEAEVLRHCAHRRTKSADLMVVEKRGKHVGVFFDKHEMYLMITVPWLVPQTIPS